MVQRIFRTLALGALTCLVAASCSKTTVETKEVVKNVHDTLSYWNKGPVFVRFISMLPDMGGTVTLWRGAAQTGTLFTNALQYTDPSYLPIADSTPLTLYPTYYMNGQQFTDSIALPALASHSLITCALFLTEDQNGMPRITSKLADDSMKTISVPKGYCCVRFINGLGDYPSPQAELYLDVDTLNHSVFSIGNVPTPVFAGDIQNYTLLPAGTHRVIIRDANNGNELYELLQVFTEGEYYTVRVAGRRTNSTDRLYIDQE